METTDQEFDDEKEELQAPIQSKFKEDDAEDDADSAVEEEEDVMVAVPTKRHEQQLDKFFVKIGSLTNNNGVPCENCQSVDDVVDFLVVSAPFGDLEERFVYLRFCKKCSKYSVYRKQQVTVETQKEEVQKEEAPKQALFGNVLDMDETPSDDQLEAMLAQMAISKSAKAKPSTSKPNSAKKSTASSSNKTKIFEFVNEDVEDDEDDLSHEKALLDRYNKEAREQGEDTFDIKGSKGVSLKSSACDAESFVTRMQIEPLQRVRYYYKGNALVPSMDAKAACQLQRTCDACGGKRTLEFQVMPQAITDIQKLTGIELDFSTILVFTCSKSCDEGSREECVVVPAI